MFEYIHSLFSQEVLKTQNDKMRFLDVIFENYLLLVKMDAPKAVNLVVSYFDQSETMFDKLVAKLSTEPPVLLQFMRLTIFENRINCSRSLFNSDDSHRKIFDLCLNSRYQEKYIELTCQLEPTTILYTLDVLQECNDLNALKICKHFGVREGEAYIYEKTKQFKKSFDILLEDFKQTVNETIQNSFNNLQCITEHLHFSAVDNKFARLLEFCKRSFKQTIEEKTKQGFCLSALEFLIETKTTLSNIFKMKNDKLLPQFLHLLADVDKKPQVKQVIINFNECFKLLFEKMINLMLTHLSLMDMFDFVVNKVLRHNEDLYDVREMMLCILENYHYEKSLLELTNNILSCEHHQLMSRFQGVNVSSKNVRQSYCGFCLGSTIGSNDYKNNLVLYSCSHLFHYECIDEIKSTKNVSQLMCPLCNGLMTDSGQFGVASEHTKQDEAVDDTNDVQTREPAHISPKADKLCLIDTQYRALNYFHHGRLRANKRK